jgi:hypothetical protein
MRCRGAGFLQRLIVSVAIALWALPPSSLNHFAGGSSLHSAALASAVAAMLFNDVEFQRNLVCPGGVRRGLNLCPWMGERLAGKRLDSSQYAIIHSSYFNLPVPGLLPARGAIRKELHHEAAQLAEGIPPPRATGPPGRASPRILLE